MSNESLCLLVRVRAKPEHAEEIAAMLQAFVGPTRSEEGCLVFEVARLKDDPTVTLLYEVWASKADLDRHHQTPALRGWNERAPAMLDGALEVTFLTRLLPAERSS